MSGGKTGKQTQEIKLPKSVTNQAKENMQLADTVGQLPYAPFFGGSVSAFQPAQAAGFRNMNSAADAFGLQGLAGRGTPKPVNHGGISAYSTERPYNSAMAQVDPRVLDLYEQFFYPSTKAGAVAAKRQKQQVSATRAGK